MKDLLGSVLVIAGTLLFAAAAYTVARDVQWLVEQLRLNRDVSDHMTVRFIAYDLAGLCCALLGIGTGYQWLTPATKPPAEKPADTER